MNNQTWADSFIDSPMFYLAVQNLKRKRIIKPICIEEGRFIYEIDLATLLPDIMEEMLSIITQARSKNKKSLKDLKRYLSHDHIKLKRRIEEI